MVYKNNVPQPSDRLSDSQADFLNNFSQLDISFGVDHYTFSDLSIDNGKHDKLTTPKIDGGVHPTPTPTDILFYAMEDTTNLGLLHYSKALKPITFGPGVATPVTSLHSPPTPILLPSATTTIVLDFIGITRAFATLRFGNMLAPPTNVGTVEIFFANGVFIGTLPGNPTSPSLRAQTAGTELVLTQNTGNPLNNVYWTLHFHRIDI